MITDLFVKTWKNDLPWLSYCLRSIEKYASGFRRVVIVVDDESQADIVWRTCRLQAPFVVPRIAPPCPVARAHGQIAGYWWQMGIKLSWMSYTDADAVVIIDSDCLFTAPVTPMTWHWPVGGPTDWRPQWFYRPWSEAGSAIVWKPSVDYFLGRESPAETMCRNGFILTVDATAGFLDFMQRRFGQTPMEYVLDERHVKPEEYEMFGGYLMTERDHGYAVIRWQEIPNWPLRQFRSWDGITEASRAEMEAILTRTA